MDALQPLRDEIQEEKIEFLLNIFEFQMYCSYFKGKCNAEVKGVSSKVQNLLQDVFSEDIFKNIEQNIHVCIPLEFIYLNTI